MPEPHEPEKDNDIHVISRESSAYPTNDNIDTLAFMQSLELPQTMPADEPLFDGLDHDFDPQLTNNMRPSNNNSNSNNNGFSEYPVSAMSPLTEFVNSKSARDHGTDSNHDYAGTLTKITNPLPPLPPLSEPVIVNSHSNAPHAMFPDFVHNSAARQQPLLTAAKKKKESQLPKARPAFVMKIWSMVNDPVNHEYIRWNEEGDSFQVVHREDFMKRILPKYFKHNNFASFVRQLNMYGWHKVQDVNSGSLKEDRVQDEILLFKNPYFIRGREDLLDKIVRNKASGGEEIPDYSQMNLQLIMGELDLIKMNQLAIMEDMRRMRNDSQTLWTESFSARDRYEKQNQTLGKIMKFLAAVYGNSAGKIFEVEDGGYNNQQVSTIPTSPSTSSLATPDPISKPRLMLMNKAYSRDTPNSHNSPAADISRHDSVEEITRNTPLPRQRDHTQNSPSAQKIFQQIMNDEGGAQLPNQFFSELNGNFLGNNPQLNSPAPVNNDLFEPRDQLQGLEQNIYKQGQALLQVQDWIQTLANRQQQQQEQLYEQQINQNQPSLPKLDDFDVNEFLDNSNTNTNLSSPDMHSHNANGTKKRVIEEVRDQDTGADKRAKR